MIRSTFTIDKKNSNTLDPDNIEANNFIVSTEGYLIAKVHDELYIRVSHNDGGSGFGWNLTWALHWGDPAFIVQSGEVINIKVA